MTAKIAVMGAGAWGTAMAKVIAELEHDVLLWSRRAELAESINRNRENAEYLPGRRLPEGIAATADAAAAVKSADIVLLATPAQSLRSNLQAWGGAVKPGALLLSLAKGLERGTKLRMTEVVQQVLGKPVSEIGVLSGPNLALEVAAGQPSGAVVACSHEESAAAMQELCAAPGFRVYTNDDVVGVELAGVVKNVIALACGIASGSGYGQNTLAVLITRGLAEITRLGVAMGAKAATFSGLAGVGDLVATCTSPLSRNRAFGVRLGLGEGARGAGDGPHGVVEGFACCGAVRELAIDHGVEMPITEAVFQVCHDGMPVREAVENLMGRKIGAE
ncbi:Glycerol-3-phosphate dehydrogenase (NAD(P)(+)) [Segniliparus rotundus DSM 44985]|uniref:Glycerol-3-phosphate dehydrogenase [NAD(P)+] n=2 Tax=Segniliparus rotundus TaxID=286802 RepID=D6ZET8_SEGRD|nr:Glycerol-3-phosphate dehydrogenase (NAD(P)(+)) [Segniliparus rotundus DSM 44985]